MNLNELIKKYKANIIECDRVINAYQLCEKTRNIHKGIKQASKEILSDLEQLKDKIYGANDYTLMIHLKKEIIGE